jgi:hypothetical protein
MSARTTIISCAALTQRLTAATECKLSFSNQSFDAIYNQLAALLKQDESFVGGLKSIARDVVRQYERQLTPHSEEDSDPAEPAIVWAPRKIGRLLTEYYEKVTACVADATWAGGRCDG